MDDVREKIGLHAHLACIWEATARKPGNVHRFRDFADTTYLDFLVSAAALARMMETAPECPLGLTVWFALLDRIKVTQRNTNLGIVLLLAPLCAAQARGGVRQHIGPVLAASEHTDRSGKDFLTALAVAYEVEAALTDAAPFMAHGFDLTTPLTYSLGAGLSRALGLDEAKAAAAIEICGAAGIPLLVVRTTPISQWKGLASSQVALGCVHGVFLAARGVTGPKYVIEGPNGLAQALGQKRRLLTRSRRRGSGK